MARRDHGRWSGAVAFSVATHLAVLGYFAVQRPMLQAPTSAAILEEPVIPVLILPRTAPPPREKREKERRPVGAANAPSPLQPRAPRLPAEAAPVAPLVLPALPSPPATPGVRPRPMTPDEDRAFRDALARRRTGCDAVPAGDGRERCWEGLGATVRGAAEAPLGLSKEEDSTFGRVAARKRANRAYRENNMPVGTDRTGGLGPTEPLTVTIP